MLGQPVIQTLQGLLRYFLERVRTKVDTGYNMVVKLTGGSISTAI